MTAHGWAEVKINGIWYMIDPDMQREQPGINVYLRTRYNYPYAYYCSKTHQLCFEKAQAVWGNK